MTINIYDIFKGDLVDFGEYGQLYVCNNNYRNNMFWVTNREEDRFKENASGWAIEKSFAKEIIEEAEFVE